MIAKFLAPLHRPIYATRLRVLVQTISPYLQPNDRLLDVGCGSGQFGASLLKANVAKNLTVHGLEKHRRGGEPIQTIEFAGKEFPFPANSYDVVTVADVLHHEEDPEQLLREALRVSRRLVIIKDHQISGPFAHQRICLIDWAANAPYGVPCLYRYNTPSEWNDIIRRLRLKPVLRQDSMNLYPPVVNFIFGRRLQFLLIAEVDQQQGNS